MRRAAAKGVAKPKATTKASASSGSGNVKGRPKRNLVADSKKIRSEFLEAQADDSAFFGVGAKATVQWLQRLVEGFDSRVTDDDMTPEAQAELAVHRKPVESILAMCRAAKKAGVESPGFLSCALEQTKYLSMEPVVEQNIFLPSCGWQPSR